MSEPQFDIEILGHGIYVITGGAWLLEHVPDAYCEGGSMAQPIADGAMGDRLAVSVNGLKYLGGNAVEKE